MNELLNKLIDEKLTKIFADYPDTKDLQELKEELSSDLVASAEDKLTEEVTESEAVTQAFKEFGDIDEVINQVLNETKTDSENQYHKTIHEHNIDIDQDSIRIDNGKVLDINDSGITVNNGKTMRIDENGVKLGNMVINEDGINFNGPKKSSFDHFNANFDDDNYETEVHVESLPMTDVNEFKTDEVNKIDIAYQDATVKILPTAGDKIIIREFMSRSNPDYQVKTELINGTLTIIQGRIPHFLPLRVKVQIMIPNDFAGNIRINNRSGNLQMMDLKNLKDVLINVRSGLIYTHNIELDHLLINANSGKVTLEDVNAKDELTLESRSGVVRLDNVFSSNYNISARSGTIKGIDLGGAGKVWAKSGIIKIDFAKIIGDISVENNSGTVKLSMPTSDSYDFDLEARSGTVKISNVATFKHDVQGLKEGTVGNDPQYNLTVHAKSGTIKVN
ncbi:DUF4097 family beta strand repeat-containing protein [Companilactobacillus kimchiensis]|uniref:DUF4097 domain-containing protein n=1 Tax=Companilactobacillus kimchiensis TaxID=993692 RepID=A0A0R2LDX9_9LACO|nr:DUF4097 family beta strand repeat-containing protein [Companilactobacillus kimchiensis]KRO00181.1 hypothetical protein IV57_GL001832 [Companilactobacillus kimchiensis]